jgi:hypothetical protein
MSKQRAALIAAARNALPGLIAVVRAARRIPAADACAGRQWDAGTQTVIACGGCEYCDLAAALARLETP